MAIPIIGGIVKEIIDKVGGVASELITDKDKQAQLKVDLARLELEMADKASERLHDEMIAQTEINKVEAANTNIFVAGWRPAIGWIGASVLGFNYILYPLAAFVARLSGFEGEIPTLTEEVILYLIGGMLGFGGLRSFEKVKGAATEVIVKKAEPEALVPPGFGTPPEEVPWKN